MVQKSTGEPATKKSRNERHIPKATEGLVLINTNMHYVVYDRCLNRLLLTLSVILLVFVKLAIMIVDVERNEAKQTV